MTQVGTLEHLMEEAVSAFNARDIDGFVATMEPDVEAHTLLSELSGTPYLGHAGLRRWWKETLDAWDYQSIELERVAEHGDIGVALFSLVGKGLASGVEMQMELAMLFRVPEEKCSYFRIFVDRDEAFREAGLDPA